MSQQREKKSPPCKSFSPKTHGSPPIFIYRNWPRFPPVFPPTLNLSKEEEEYRKSISHREEITISTFMALPRQSIEIYIFLSFKKNNKTKRKQLLWFKFPAISELAIEEFLYGGNKRSSREEEEEMRKNMFFCFFLLFGPAEKKKKKKKTENKRWETSSFINHSRTIFVGGRRRRRALARVPFLLVRTQT